MYQVLLAWSKSRGMEGKIKTEQLLHQMQEMADKGDTSLRPDRVRDHHFANVRFNV